MDSTTLWSADTHTPLEFPWRFAAERTARPEPLVDVLKAELDNSFAALQRQPQAAYYLAYQVIERKALGIEASLGAIVSSHEGTARNLEVEVRVGSPQLDNSHLLPGESTGSSFRGIHSLPQTDNGPALRNAIWLATDAEYDAARTAFMRAVAGAQVEEQKEERVPDFSLQQPKEHFEPRIPLEVDSARAQALLVQLSRVALDYPSILTSSAQLSVVNEFRTLVNSEGSRQQLSSQLLRLEVAAETIAKDGMRLSRNHIVDVTHFDLLPPLAELERSFHNILRQVSALEEAPVIEPYVGPALLDGRAAGVFFHEIFGHRVEGHRQRSEQEGQTFTNMLGQRIMHPSLDVFDDPRLRALGPIELNGHYMFDDEGVAGARAPLVEAGVLKGFLLSRTPIKGFERSNGHGRRQPAYAAVARQANLIVQPRYGLSENELKGALIREVKRQGLAYGLRFEEIVGGYTQTQRQDTQAFKVMPVMVYRVFPDGSEELVRGVDIEGTPLTALSKIVEVGAQLSVFNGMCGAESGWVPVSAVSPAVLVSQLEVARQESSNAKRPLLPAPALTSTQPERSGGLQ